MRKIGEGGFAEVYEVLDTSKNSKCALKIEKADIGAVRGQLLKAEHRVLRKLHEKGSPQVVEIVEDGYGVHEGRAFFAMELLGMNLAQMQRSTPGNRWGLEDVCLIGARILASLHSLHDAGYIHRDVKPANFAVCPRDGRDGGEWKVLDFGIARRYITEGGTPIPQRMDFNEFRGSTTYASINAHTRSDLGRRDDLWSWLYIMVEMLDGSLPWRQEGMEVTQKEAAREMAQQLKQECIQDPDLLTTEVPSQEVFHHISRHLETLSFDAEPDYNLLSGYLSAAALPGPAKPGNAASQPPLPQEAYPKEAGGDTAGISSPAGLFETGEKRGREAAEPSEQWRENKRTRKDPPAMPQLPQPSHPSNPYPYPGVQPQPQPQPIVQPQQWGPYPQNGYPSHPYYPYIAPTPTQEPPSAATLAEMGEWIQQGCLSPQAASLAEAVGQLEPAEGLGIVSWIVQQLASSRLEPSGRATVVLWLQQLSKYVDQTVEQLKNAPS